MLRNILYLNEQALNGYLSVFEDGTRGAVTATTTKSSSKGAGIDARVLNAKIDKGVQTAETASRDDTPSARFDRLRSLALSTGDVTDWFEIGDDPDTDLGQVTRGMLIEVQCETYIPDTIKAMSSMGGIAGLFEQLNDIRTIAPALGLDTPGLPGMDQIKALQSLTGSISFDATVVGEVSGSTTWRLKTKLQEEYLKGDVEGNVTIVGKGALTPDRGHGVISVMPLP
jgi:hypothetical protein